MIVEVPLLGRVAAGQPILAQEHHEDRLRVDRLLIGNHREIFALRIQGDSMIDAESATVILCLCASKRPPTPATSSSR